MLVFRKCCQHAKWMILRVLNTPLISFILQENLDPRIVHVALKCLWDTFTTFSKTSESGENQFCSILYCCYCRNRAFSRFYEYFEKTIRGKTLQRGFKDFIFLVCINENLQNNCFLYILQPKICRKSITKTLEQSQEKYLEPYQRYKMELFVKIVNGWKPWTTFAKIPASDVNDPS